MATYSSRLENLLENLMGRGAWRATVHRLNNNITFQNLSKDPLVTSLSGSETLTVSPVHRVKCSPSTWPSRMFTTPIIVLPHLYCSRHIPWSDQGHLLSLRKVMSVCFLWPTSRVSGKTVLGFLPYSFSGLQQHLFYTLALDR